MSCNAIRQNNISITNLAVSNIAVSNPAHLVGTTKTAPDGVNTITYGEYGYSVTNMAVTNQPDKIIYN